MLLWCCCFGFKVRTEKLPNKKDLQSFLKLVSIVFQKRIKKSSETKKKEIICYPKTGGREDPFSFSSSCTREQCHLKQS